MSSAHRHQTEPPYAAPLLPYAPPYAQPPPHATQPWSFKDGASPPARYFPPQLNYLDPPNLDLPNLDLPNLDLPNLDPPNLDPPKGNSRWVTALSGDMGEAAQRDAHEKLSTQLTSTVHHFLLHRQPNLQWLATLDAIEIDALTQDLVQVCLLKLSRDEHALLAKYSGIGSFRGWVTQIAINVARSELRKAQWDRNQPLDTLFALPNVDSSTPESTLMQGQLASVLHHCLAQLPDHYKTVLVRCVMHGERTDAVAHDLGRTSQAVYNLVSRAKKALRRLLAEAGVDAEDLAVFEG